MNTILLQRKPDEVTDEGARRYNLAPLIDDVMEGLHDDCLRETRAVVRYGSLTPAKRMAGFIFHMAEIWPNEGSDIALGQFPKNDTRITQLLLCLFTSQTASTTITEAQVLSNITETSYTSYARQLLATATWGALAAGTGATGRKTSYSQITFPTVGVTGATINGAFVGYDGTSGAGGSGSPTKCVMQANFDDVTAVVLATNDIIKVTPYMQLNP